MKKLLSILTSVGLSSSAFSVTLSSSKNVIHNNVKSDESNLNSVEWAEVKKMTFDIFNRDMPLQFANDVSNNKNIVNKQLSQNNIKDTYLQKAKEESEKIINKFTEQNISLDKALDFIKAKYPQFEKEYNKQISTYQEQNYSTLTNSYLEETKLKNSYKESFNYINNSENVEKYNISFSSAYQKNGELVSRLKTAKISFVTLTAASAVAAAGFYAAAPWTLGATIPWAAGCTAISIGSGLVTAGLSGALLAYDEKAEKWDKARNAGSVAINAAQALGRIAKTVLVSFTATATPFIWAMPAVVAVISIAVAVASWINYNF
ncbi:hypothetical protein [Spiroplasma floricola]|uniref:Transmembrane protein n=1 Tax=Spiroplasma floricola 23-6 TaxID=1336749 RepID=A0A2K8SEX7_9MOLU|nr:hypothetical protein [Spiroplasma floricola]AUB31973.1 hypothetical protein SFLOR_v1c09250 [Spiroplasma floricola 23-6]